MTISDFLTMGRKDQPIAVFGRNLEKIAALEPSLTNKIYRRVDVGGLDAVYHSDIQKLKESLPNDLVLGVYNLMVLYSFKEEDIFWFDGVDTVLPFLAIPGVQRDLEYMSPFEIIINTKFFE